MEFDKILQIANSDVVNKGIDLPKVYLHKWLVLGQTEHVCKYGTLSDGHEKITASQRYAQALKEWYYLSVNIRSQRSIAKRAQADLLDAQDELKQAETAQDILRAEADLDDAQTRLLSSLVSIEDQMRMVRVYEAEAKSLSGLVEGQYPEGIEQAEEDNWKAVLEYRMMKERVQGMARESTSNIPLSPQTKAELGYKHGRLDAVAPLAISAPTECLKLEERMTKMLEHKQEIR